MNKKLTLTKDQIKSIKYYFNNEGTSPFALKAGEYKLTNLKVHANGDYSFRVHWTYQLNLSYPALRHNIEDIKVSGNLFKEFPIYAVIDGLDAVQLLMIKFHCQSLRRISTYIGCLTDKLLEHYKYLTDIYNKNSGYNKEGKDVDQLNLIECILDDYNYLIEKYNEEK